MENQHKKIIGYRELDQIDINNMNEVKALGEKVRELIAVLERNGTGDARWRAIAETDLQKGFMALVRSIAQPTTF